MNTLVSDPTSAGAISALGGLQEEYVELFDFSEAIAMDATTARVCEGKREVRRKKDAQIAELQAELDELESKKSGLFRR